ncbi:MAG TPA: ATP-dependent DNA helicase [Mycobacteriales bacterium]|nr:ATP-dependent DNA helicase [Mycobacteriales bacterium]
MSSPYRLDRTPPVAAVAPVLDPAQRAVLDHEGGPLLVLAGPGTGKTTTLVELVASRVEAGVAADEILLLTFSRRAAAELRERVTMRVGPDHVAPAAWTFHAWCYAFLRQEQSPELFSEPLRLLSAPEQDVALRDMLRGSLDTGRPAWPADLRTCLMTRGLAEEVRALFARARAAGLEPSGLGELARHVGRDDWASLALLFADYLDVLDLQNAVDYAELVHRAANRAAEPSVQARLRAQHKLVVVDEYQDTDPVQERLLRALAGDGGNLIVVGDPDQAIYAFRGAEVKGLLEFPRRFPRADGRDAPVLALETSRRAGATLLAASRRVASRLPVSTLPAGALREYRKLVPDTTEDGTVEVVTTSSVGAEAEWIADLLRREHLENGTPWSRMAVLVRSAVQSVPLLRRVLTAAGVPVEVAGDELPLAREPAVAPLLLALRVVDDPEALTPETARLLLLSPLGGADPAGLRRLGRALRHEDEKLARESDGPRRLPAPSSRLIREAVADPRLLLAVEERIARPAQRLSDLLARAREHLHAADGGPEAALWSLWSGSAWPRRLEQASRAGGPAGRAADRDLDAVVALFAALERASLQRSRVAGVKPLLDELEAQQIPGDTLAERALRADSVRLLTAHRSKGLEWDVVVVAGVQEGAWPDVRRRGSLLEPERLESDDPAAAAGPTRTELLADERRLFYVAITRARRRLVVTAASGAEDEGERPSPFLDELGVDVVHVPERLDRPFSLPALVAALRCASVDPTRSPAMRTAAATRLARLAHARDDDGDLLVPGAHPDRWWGMRATTVHDEPVRPPDEPIRLSGSALSGIAGCPLRWFLEREAKAQQPQTTALGFGGVLHALAHEVATGRTPADIEALDKRLDRVWGELGFEAAWQREQQREQAREALRRFLSWTDAARGRTFVGAEAEFEVTVELPSGPVMLRGSIDRVERDAEGRAHIVDFKTGKTIPSDKSVLENPQLGVYQIAVREGGLDDLLGGDRRVGGAELVQLRDERAKQPGLPKVQVQDPIPDGPDTWIDLELDGAAARVRAEDFRPVRSDGCDRCLFRRCCPAHPEGEQVVT